MTKIISVLPHKTRKTVFEIIDANHDRKLNKPEIVAHLKANSGNDKNWPHPEYTIQGASVISSWHSAASTLAKKTGILSIDEDLFMKLASRNYVSEIYGPSKDKERKELETKKKSYTYEGSGAHNEYVSFDDIADYILGGKAWIGIDAAKKHMSVPKK
jgi:hypothetical protein